MTELRFRGFFRPVLSACATSFVSSESCFRSLFALTGFELLLTADRSLDALSIGLEPVEARGLIIIALTWRWTGYNGVYSQGCSIDRSISKQHCRGRRLNRVHPVSCPWWTDLLLTRSDPHELRYLTDHDLTTAGRPNHCHIPVLRLYFSSFARFGYAAPSFVVFCNGSVFSHSVRVGGCQVTSGAPGLLKYVFSFAMSFLPSSLVVEAIRD